MKSVIAAYTLVVEGNVSQDFTEALISDKFEKMDDELKLGIKAIEANLREKFSEFDLELELR